MLINPLTQQPITDEELRSISSLAARQVLLAERMAAMQADIDQVSDQLRTLSEVTLPEAMTALGMSEFKLADGSKVTVSKFYSAKIPEERADEAFTFLRNSGHDDLIKNELKLLFGKGEDEKAREVAMNLVKQGLPVEQRISVHPQTLKAFVREQIEGGKDLPTDLFGVYVGNRTKITPARK